ncbi:MAG: TldD/PmbA family protein [Planctomycetota bacterium]|jgi:TldD protein
MFELLENALASSTHWTELRYHKRTNTDIVIDKGEVRVAQTGTTAGIGVRVLVDGAWGFSSTAVVESGAVRKAIEEATAIARFMSGARKEKAVLAPHSSASGEFVPETEDPVTSHSLEEKIELSTRIEELTRSRNPLIVSSSSGYRETIDEKYIVTSEGVRCHMLIGRPEFRAGAVAGKDGEFASGGKSIGVTGGWSDLFTKGLPEELSEYAARMAVDKLTAPYPEGGVYTVVMDPEMVGLLAHEAIGHTVEADFVLSGSIAAGKIGKNVASELVTLCDSGTSEIEPLAAGQIPVDDEGTQAGKTVVIENGILVSYLHNRETARLFDVEPTGNARAWEYNNEPLIRMRNTYIEPGSSTVEEMIAGIKDGYYISGSGGGQADSNAEFMFGSSEIHRIRNGKKAGLLRDATISGQAFDVLKSVDAVGNNFEWAMGSGYCGKLQPAKVDGGGPSIRCRVTVSGKQGG